jgi:3',5'-cyclic AMP phosphodiesterase CpdA
MPAGSRVSTTKQQVGPFLVKPYLQWGDSPSASASGSLILWQVEDAEAEWVVEYRPGPDRPWRPAAAPAIRRIAVKSIAPHRLYRAVLSGLEPGGEFSYRVRKDGEIVFGASGHAPKPADKPHRFVVFGDCGMNTAEQKAVAYQAYQAQPDFVMITGDIVYDRGRVSEYREKFWPIYNADEASPSQGAPLLRSTLFLASPGNHDIGTRDLGSYPDGLAYFLYWAQPLNGPPGAEGSAHVPPLVGPDENKKAFLEAAGPTYPRMGNFSFDYGNAHWTVLDANPYVDWTDRELRSWVQRDLASAQGATWRFVAIHQPGFNSARKHADEQNMRLMAEIFESGGVDLVFCGHVHNYQRTFPLRFVSDKDNDSKPIRRKELVSGRWTLDRTFDGQTKTRPEGIIYVVTGAGGASLYNPEQQDDPSSWQEFTHKFISKIHSLTVAEVNGSTLTVRQVSLHGEELDRFRVTK